MGEEQVTFRELVKDPVFRAWMLRKPEPPPTLSGGNFRKWRVWVQQEKGGRWLRKDFNTWKKAMKFIKAHWKQWHDLALNCKNDSFKPPVVRAGGKKRFFVPSLPPKHRWCGFCRRPTRFAHFSRHHAIPGSVDQAHLRCVICGCREQLSPQVKLITRENLDGEA